jgi:mannose-6-phosphate isomerase-like protein (cupin superfamily)
MPPFAAKSLPPSRDAVAPDGSDVRILLGLSGGSMAHFALPPSSASRAVTHRTVDEIWFVLQGRGEMWRRQGEREEVLPLNPGLSLTIPQGTHFQVRCSADAPLAAIGITIPPWPGENEAMVVEGKWTPSLPEER